MPENSGILNKLIKTLPPLDFTSLTTQKYIHWPIWKPVVYILESITTQILKYLLVKKNHIWCKLAMSAFDLYSYTTNAMKFIF